MKRCRAWNAKRKAPWHGLDSTARKYPANYDYYTPKNRSGWNQQVCIEQVLLICCGNQGCPPLFILRGDTCTQRLKRYGAQWLVEGAVRTAKARAAWLSVNWHTLCQKRARLPLAI